VEFGGNEGVILWCREKVPNLLPMPKKMEEFVAKETPRRARARLPFGMRGTAQEDEQIGAARREGWRVLFTGP